MSVSVITGAFGDPQGLLHLGHTDKRCDTAHRYKNSGKGVKKFPKMGRTLVGRDLGGSPRGSFALIAHGLAPSPQDRDRLLVFRQQFSAELVGAQLGRSY